MYQKSLFKLCLISIVASCAIAQNSLDEIVVTSKSIKSIDDLSNSITVITSDDIKKINATNLKDILVKTSGVVKTVSNQASLAGRENVSLRGMDSSSTLILIDGKKINPTEDYIGHSDFQYSWVPIEIIERIEIIKGPKSSIYGSQALGGVVNIITKKSKKNFFAEISAKYGYSSSKSGGSTDQQSLNFGGNINDKLFIFLGANRGFRKETGGEGLNAYTGRPISNATYIEGYDTRNAIAKMKFNIDDTQNINALYIVGKEQRRNYGGIISYDISRFVYNVGYEKAFEDILFSIDYTKSNSNAIGSSYTHQFDNDNLKAEAKISYFDHNYFILGFETSKDYYGRKYPNTSRTKSYSFNSRTNSYYAQDEIEISDFIFTLGARLDDSQKYGKQLSPNIGGVYKVTENQRIKLNYSEGFKTPTLTKGTSSFGTGTHRSPYGNDNLKPESSKSGELSYEFYYDTFTFKTAGFKTNVNNLINTAGNNGNVKYINVGKAEIYGGELGLDYDIIPEQSINFNYTYLKTKNLSSGKELTYKPDNTLNIGLSSKFPKNISSYISANYVGKQFTDESNKTRVDGYVIFNAQVSIDTIKNFTAKIGIDNIANKNFKDSTPYALEQRLSYIQLTYKY